MDVFAQDNDGSVSDLGATVEGGENETGLSASSETTVDTTGNSTEQASTATERKCTRSGRDYSGSTACSTSTIVGPRKRQLQNDLQHRAAKSSRLTTRVDLTLVSAMKAKRENQGTTVMLQIGPDGPYVKASPAHIK
jgi:hypothetical protein